jgi:hypothetical protein
MGRTGTDKLTRKRNTLAEARRATQAKMAPLIVVTLAICRLCRDTPWLIVASGVLLVGLSTRWLRQYRRLRVELGLQHEYDEVDENATAGTKVLLIMFGVFAGMFVFLGVFIWAFGKR